MAVHKEMFVTPTRMSSLLLAAVLFCVSACTSPGMPKPSAPVQDTGMLDAAPYRIDIPENWNGDLVALLHGYEPKGSPRQQPWPQNEAAPLFLAKGYAVIESGYSSQGWAVADAVADTERLRAYFVEKYRKPRRAYLVGFSMGGLAVLKSAELYGKSYDGALSLCGANMPAGTVFQDAVLTPLVAFDYFFPGAMGLAAGGLADPASPAMLDSETIERELQKNEATATLLSKRLDIPRPGLAGALMLYNLVLREAASRAGGFPVDNRSVAYSGFGDDEAFNRGVRRYAGDPRAIASIDGSAELTGNIQAPVVLQPSALDPTVPARFNHLYPELVRSRGTPQPLLELPAVGEGHCGFANEQIAGAFDRLLQLHRR